MKDMVIYFYHLTCNSSILFVIPARLLSPLFSVIFSNPPICHTFSSPLLEIKLFQLIKSPKLKIDFHQ